jgi:hypothetical protein
MLLFLSLFATESTDENTKLFHFLQEKFTQISGEFRDYVVLWAPYNDQVAINKELGQIDQFEGIEKIRNQLSVCTVILSIWQNSCLGSFFVAKYASQLNELEFGCDVVEKADQLRESLKICLLLTDSWIFRQVDQNSKIDWDIIVDMREKKKSDYIKNKRPQSIAQTVFFYARFDYQFADLILEQMLLLYPEGANFPNRKYYDQTLVKCDALKQSVIMWLTRERGCDQTFIY